MQYQSLYGQQQNLLVTTSLKKGEAELIQGALKVPCETVEIGLISQADGAA